MRTFSFVLVLAALLAAAPVSLRAQQAGGGGPVLSPEQLGALKMQETQQRLAALQNGGGNSGGNNTLDVGAPESDCEDAIAVCQQTYTQTQSYSNYGDIQELSGTCLASNEQKTVWYVFTVQNSGTFGFMINTPNDYDFALFGPNATCGALGTPIRCNYSATYGNTGLNAATPSGGNISIGAGGAPIMNGLNVVAGQTYILVIDNYTGNTNGYTITFSGTAQIFDVSPPTVLTMAQSCNANTLTFNFSEQVDCATIQLADFVLGGAGAPAPVSFTGCGTASFTTSITVTYAAPVASGTWTVNIPAGAISDKCGNPIVAFNSTFSEVGPFVIAGGNTCAGGSVTLNGPAQPAGFTYAWSSGQNTQNVTVSPSATANYTVTVTSPAPSSCTNSATATVTIDPDPVVSVDIPNMISCSGSGVVTASASLPGGTFTWRDNTNAIVANTASFNVTTAGSPYTVSYSLGLCASNVVTVTASSPAAPANPTCLVFYASPAGGGTGLTAGSPTTLVNALDLAGCSAAVIKLMQGTYNIDNEITNVRSFVTLEGGYDATYTNKSNNVAATVINRTTANPDGPANQQRIIAFQIANETDFTFNNLTIQTANANLAGESAYAVHLTNCADYRFIRCVIDAGDGAQGATGATGAAGLPGGNGGVGGNGNNDDEDNAGTGGGGGGGAGTAAGNNGGNGLNNNAAAAAGGAAGASGGGGAGNGGGGGGTTNSGGRAAGQLGGAGAAAAACLRCGGGGGGGGAGSGEANSGSAGAGGGAGGGGAAGGNQTGTSGSNGCSGNSRPGANGNLGAVGAAGAAGAAGPAGAHAAGFWVPGTAGGVGTDGAGGGGGSGGGGGAGQGGLFCVDGAGSGGGGGGGGGQGGQGGQGGLGGGASFSVYLFNNGTGGQFIDAEIRVGVGSAGGAGGAGGNGGNGGAGGAGSTYSSGEVGTGGNGAAGRPGGAGGQGGSGSAGAAFAVFNAGPNNATASIFQTTGATANTTLTAGTGTNPGAYVFANEPTLTVANITCANTNIAFSETGAGTFTSLDGANPLNTGDGNFTRQYTTLGRKTFVHNNGGTQTRFFEFHNIEINADVPVLTASDNVICAGQSVDFVVTNANNGYTYVWNLGGGAVPNTYSGTQFSSLTGIVFNTPGVYVVSVQFQSECCGLSTAATVNITVQTQPDLNPIANVPYCAGGVPVALTATGTGVTTFNWAPASGLSATTGATVNASPLATTTYTVTGLNATGTCQDQTSVTVNVTTLSLALTGGTVACSGNGSVSVVVGGGSGNYTINWTDNLGNPVGTGLSVNGLGVGTYTANVTDNTLGCTATGSVAVTNAPTLFTVQTAAVQNPACVGQANGSFQIQVQNGTPNYTYTVTNSGGATVFGPTTQAGTTINVTGLADDTYTITATDNGGCDATTNQLIKDPQGIVITVDAVVNLDCNGVNDGEITVSATGGTGTLDYSIDGGTAQATGVFTGLDGGNHVITVTDDNGCTATQNQNLTEPAAITGTLALIQDVQCFGQTNGGVQVNGAGGGTGTLEYTISPGGTVNATGVFNGLGDGSYTVTIEDDNGCELVTNSITVAEPAALSASAAVTDAIDCFGGTGQITVTASNGTSPYDYTLGATTNTTGVFGGLVQGTYNFVVTDDNGCTFNLNGIALTQPTQLTGSLALVQNVQCNGAANGSVQVNGAGGGTGTLDYTLNPGGTNNATGVFTGLAPGAYTVTITDDNGCTRTTNSISVTQPNALTASVTSPTFNGFEIACNGASTGTVNLTVGGGTPNFDFQWSGSSTAITEDLANVPAGTYNVLVTDDNGCTATASITLDEPTAVTANATSPTFNGFEIACNGASTGSIDLTAGGGVGGFDFQWSNGSTATTEDLANVPVGTYDVVVTDDNGCTANTSITLDEPAAIAGTLALTQDVQCNGANDGAVEVNGATGGVGTLEFTLNPGGTVNATGTFTGLAPDDYTVTIEDDNGCTLTTNQITVAEPTALTASGVAATYVGGVNISCNGEDDGSIILTINGGTNPYTLNWNGPNGFTSTQVNISGLFAGTYTLTGTDGNNCPIGPLQFVLSEPTEITASLAITDSISCNGANDAELTTTASGGTAPLQYSLNASPPQASGVFVGVSAWAYNVTVTDANGCSMLTNIVTVIDPDPLTATLAVSDSVSCFNVADGRLTATASGGIGPFSYSLNGGPGQASGVFLNRASGNYTVTVTDAHGCTQTATATLVNPPALVISNIVVADPSCNGATDGSITVTTTGGTPGLTFSNGVATTAGTSPFVFANQAGGNYTITVTDAHGCTATGTAQLTPSAILRPRASVDASRVCLPGIVQFDGSASTTTVGTIVTYDWAFGDGNTGVGVQASNTYAAAGTYNVTLTITSSTGCVYDSTFVAMVTALPDAVADFTSTPTRDDYINTDNAEIRFQDLSQNAVRWLWDFGNGNTSTQQNPTFELPGGFTCVSLTVFNDAVLNCPSTDTLCYNVVDEGLHVPTAFVPGGSGPNAFFHPFTHEVFETYEMRIYDRWGIEIAAFSDILPGWDGKKNGELVPEGVYTFRIVFKRRNSTESLERTGTVTVLH